MSTRNRIASIVLVLSSCWSVFAEDGPAERVLLFRSGRVLGGRLTTTDTHYVITQTVGRIQIPKEEIEHVCFTIEQAYQYKLARINPSDPDEHAELAQWCLQVGLRDQAIHEFEDVERLAPGRSGVKNMIEILRKRPRVLQASLQAPPKTPTEEPAEIAAPAPAPKFSFGSEQMSRFTIHIQPMLLRSCATAGCHTPAHQGKFVLRRFVRANRITTEKNLHAVLTQVHPRFAEKSPLLIMASSAHGGSSQPPLFQARNESLENLKTWLIQIVNNRDRTNDTEVANVPSLLPLTSALGKPVLPPLEPPRRKTDQSTAGSVVQADLIQSPDALPSTNPSQTGYATPVKPVTNVESVPLSIGTSSPSPFPSTSVATPRKPPSNYTPVDPFDPELFNRTYH